MQTRISTSSIKETMIISMWACIEIILIYRDVYNFGPFLELSLQINKSQWPERMATLNKSLLIENGLSTYALTMTQTCVANHSLRTCVHDVVLVSYPAHSCTPCLILWEADQMSKWHFLSRNMLCYMLNFQCFGCGHGDDAVMDWDLPSFGGWFQLQHRYSHFSGPACGV